MKHSAAFLMIFFLSLLGSCKDNQKYTKEQSIILSQVDSSVTQASGVIKLLKQKADSLKPLNEFESIKLYNSIYMLEENTTALKSYHDSLLKHSGDAKSLNNLCIEASTQAEYVNGLVTAGKALYNNKSFSIGQWKDGTPKPIHDSIVTPIKKQ
jgi:hypothetical protein